MNNEIEAKFLNVNKDEIRRKLTDNGAKLERPETLMRRKVFYTGPHSFARVRDEGDRIVMTYKNFEDEDSIMGVKEVNLVVESFDDAVNFLEGCGLQIKADQETYRELWLLDGVEITIDTWPWLDPYIEIEGHSEESVWQVAEKLGLDKNQAVFGAVDKIYHMRYGVDMEVVNQETPIINFTIAPPEWVERKLD